jgi:hypothetical protein
MEFVAGSTIAGGLTGEVRATEDTRTCILSMQIRQKPSERQLLKQEHSVQNKI